MNIVVVYRFGNLFLLVFSHPPLLQQFLKFGLGSRFNMVIQVLSMPRRLQDSVSNLSFLFK